MLYDIMHNTFYKKEKKNIRKFHIRFKASMKFYYKFVCNGAVFAKPHLFTCFIFVIDKTGDIL